MINNLFLGAIDNLSVDDIKQWVESAISVKKPQDIIALVVYRATDEVLNYLTQNDVVIYHVTHDSFNQPIQHQTSNSPTISHNMRMFHFWELLTRIQKEHNFSGNVVVTDVRDVYFQKYPFDLFYGKIVVSNECIRYENESWGADNFKRGYGPVIWKLSNIARSLIVNVGAIMGGCEQIKSLSLMIYNMTLGRHYPSDQSSFNFIIRNSLMQDNFSICDDFAAHLGTTADPTKSHLWNHVFFPPKIDENGIVKTIMGVEVAIVHQWDRVPQLRKLKGR